jgi:hypothetical protein
MYGNNYAESVNSIWSADHADDLPENAEETVFITFYCDFSGVWPWDPHIQLPRVKDKLKNAVPLQSIQSKPILLESNSISSIQQKSISSRTVHKSAVSIVEKIRAGRPRKITIIKAVKTKPPSTTPKPEINRLPSVMVIDLSSATSKPPVKNDDMDKRLGKSRHVFPNMSPLQDKRLFTPRNLHNEFQRHRQSPQGTTEGFQMRGKESLKLDNI